MKTCRITCLVAALLLAAGCNIQFNAPVFPQDTSSGDVIGGDIGIDIVVPDQAGPDVALKTCAELDGQCYGAVDGVERNAEGCPWGYGRVNAEGCGDDAWCCVVSEDCVDTGETFMFNDVGVGCCPGLGSENFCNVNGFEGCDCPGVKYVCTECGDGVCEEWENPCICLADCPWGVMNECKENGGSCMSACPPGHMPLDLDGCEGEDICCSMEGECLSEGQVAEYAPGSPPCCGTLAPIDVTEWGGGELGCQPDENWYVCSYCGNNNCENHESPCTCPQDCDEILKNVCEEEGGMCWEDCPEGWTPVYTPGCSEDLQCCMKNGGGCVGEGQQIPGGPFSEYECCAGLDEIEDITVGEEGECDMFPSMGMICSDCGNGGCESWENWCNCPYDCAWVIPPDGCDPTLPGSPECDPGQLCAVPYACDISAPIGTCIEIPESCAQVFEPVCTCNGNEYQNDCQAHMAEENVAWFGPCLGEDDKGCVGLGESGDVADPLNDECCGDLNQMDLMIPLPDDECQAAPGFVCVKCEDGVCGPGENYCICPFDCPNFGSEPIPG